MAYLSSKKIFPGNWAEPLNGWYKNIDTNDDSTNDKSKGGPTAVLAVPGWKYFQNRGYAEVTGKVAAKWNAADVIVPSPYRNDDTRTDITGMVVSASAGNPAYVYRAAASVADGWGDGRVASGVYTDTGNVISFGRSNGGNPTNNTLIAEACAQANIASTVDGTDTVANAIFFSGGASNVSTPPIYFASGLNAGGALKPDTTTYKAVADTTWKVFTKDGANGTAAADGVYLSDADADAGNKGYIVVEVCYMQQDDAPGYADIEQYLTNRTVS
jgi:hypothetical protein